MRLLVDEPEAALEVDVACRGEGVAGPQAREVVPNRASELERVVEKSNAEAVASAGGATVGDWLELLADAQSRRVRRGAAGEAERTPVLAVLR